MKKKYLVIVSVLVLAMVLLAGCAAGVNPTVDVPDADGNSAGFWMGLWHGIISPVTFIISLFSDNVNIYEVYNSGNWYDFGFMFGVCIIFSGGARGTCRKK
jgi:hypothetical protein